MWPILIKTPFFPIHTYGVMMALGFLFGSWYVGREAKRCGEDPAKALDLIFYILISAIIGSRILHVLVNERDLLLQNPLHLFKIWQGGLVFYGGFIGAFVTAYWYLWKHRLPIWKYGDFLAPAIALGHALGRIGCFFAGCCHGRPLLSPTWYSVVFPPGGIAPAGIPLYPTQLMESGAEFAIFGFLAWKLHHKKFDGQIFTLYAMLYAIVRFWLEFLRGDTDRGTLFGGLISTSQFIAIAIFVVAVAGYFCGKKHAKV